MRYVFGVTGLIASIVVGLYVGFWVCFVGGLVDIVTEIASLFISSQINVWTVVWGIVRFMFAGTLGYLSFVVLFIPSLITLGWSEGKTKVKVRLFNVNRK